MTLGINQSTDAILAGILSDIRDLKKNGRGASQYPVANGNGAVRVWADQDAHGFQRGTPVYNVGGVWSQMVGSAAAGYALSLWGVVDRVAGPNRFSVVVSGPARIPGASLTPGYFYAFNGLGELVEAFTSQYPPSNSAAHVLAVKAIDTDKILVVNDSKFDGLASDTGVYTTVTHADIGIGNFVVYRGVPGSESPLALADEANPWKWTNVGIALFEIGSSGTWLVLISGENVLTLYGVGDARPAWMTTPAFNSSRPYLSETNPGQYATTEPAFKVFAGLSGASYAPASPPSPEETTFTASARGQGIVYPIPPSGGGTGTDVSLLDEHSVLFMDTYGSPSARKIAGILSATSDYSILAQKSGQAPEYLLLDLLATGSFEVAGGVLYSRLCGKRSSTTAPVDKMFARYNGSVWEGYGPLMSNLGEMLTHNGTDLSLLDASVPLSIVGNPTDVAAAPSAISAPAEAVSVPVSDGAAISWLELEDGHTVVNRAGVPTSELFPAGSGPPTGSVVLTSGTSWSIPAGVKHVLAIALGAGGGSSSSGTTIVGYYAFSSGGSPTMPLSVFQGGGGGGSAVVALLDVDGLTSLTYAIGAGGAQGAPGGSTGGDTTITATDISITGGGGGGGLVQGLAGQPLAGAVSSGSRVLWSYKLLGKYGGAAMSPGVSIGGSGHPAVVLGSPIPGLGGNWNAGGGTPGTNGAIMLMWWA